VGGIRWNGKEWEGMGRKSKEWEGVGRNGMVWEGMDRNGKEEEETGRKGRKGKEGERMGRNGEMSCFGVVNPRKTPPQHERKPGQINVVIHKLLRKERGKRRQTTYIVYIPPPQPTHANHCLFTERSGLVLCILARSQFADLL
jgi:hypothetical protein